jgi:hypothetical protein
MVEIIFEFMIFCFNNILNDHLFQKFKIIIIKKII